MNVETFVAAIWILFKGYFSTGTAVRNSRQRRGFRLQAEGEGETMDEVKSLFWRLAAVTFIVVSVLSAMAYLAVSAID
jgi:hypothetical protein